MPEALLLAALFFAAALLYSSVGHAGASAYLAAMALVGLPPEVMRPTALVLNLLVATIVIVRFRRAGQLPWRPVVPLVATSIPMAFLGGVIQLPSDVYRPLVGAVLLFGAWRLGSARLAVDPERTRVPVIGGMAVGGLIGLLAGLTGTGGGIFLTPILLLAGWARSREAAGLSGAFILANSASGLAGVLTGGLSLPAEMPIWLLAVAGGGLAGSWLGAARYSILSLRRALAVVLVIAAGKLIFFP
jgi:uncharacterized protein